MRHRMGRHGKAGLGFFDVLLIVFVVLKLVGVIEWSWWWVLSPIWIGVLLVLVIYFVIWILDD